MLEDTLELRRALIAHARKLTTSGLTRNTSGNLSHRVTGGFLVTPSGMDYERLEPDDIVFVDFDGKATGRRLPSSEWHFHREILARRAEISVVLHAHSPFATSIACLREGIPAFHYMVAVAGGADIRCAPYATFGTRELSDLAVTALEGRKACLLANHGQIALGTDFTSAHKLAVEVETLAEMYWRTRQIGTPIILDAVEMAIVLEKFLSYGKQPALPARE
ncbi:MAG TPA: class II aldolase/adducin family protein [Aliidongia sp.]|uniref:class II aldolase/adducin family protein n=1 Tax=Aliidongia sp. TaxID=1914230 RepID=UPI002DDCBF76|nr:class II aldolase/adducin family protein [Aliidongia sp.]HEV2675744.1 class II aldolase/adducin family protein [Aliidongia sp.]